MHSGNFVLVLHTHLPWVLNHGRWPHGVDWLCEAVAECYIPLLNVFNDLKNEGILPRVSLDISPVLCEQLEHPEFKKVFINYCKEKVKSARVDEIAFNKWGYDAHHIYLTKYWQEWYEGRMSDFLVRYNSSIIGSMRTLQDSGAIEILTCGASHGYLPLLGYDKSINLQIRAAVENYKKHFGRQPRGIWLPECAYRGSYDWKSLIPVNPFHQTRLRPGIEQFLAKNGIEFFFTDQPLTERSSPLGAFLDENKEKFVGLGEVSHKHKYDFSISPLKLFNVSSSDKIEYGTATAFTRHRDLAMLVWSGETGYPGEPDYLDFHKKNLGSMLRYWRVTDNKADMMYKMLYHPDWTSKKIDLQSNHFVHHIENTLNYYKNTTGREGNLCTPFDTELFGHWWFEGPEFIRAVIKGLSNSPYVNTTTASEELYRHKPLEIYHLPEGSWGENNNHDVWSNPDNVWTWEAIYNDELRLNNLFEQFHPGSLTQLQRRVFTQALRELMLLHSSDWQFLIFTQSAKDYAEQRFSYHHSDFNLLCDFGEKACRTGELSSGEINQLSEIEKRNSLFAELKLEWWE
ncbi:MAG: 1,4-alpha-glucan branching enzyme [Ignavibacteria bacterium]|nr:1,4-alpha-glucan branching enzyme [Ignavibacteria bacterium]